MTRTLIVIDVQQDYFEGGALPQWEAEACEARIADAMKKVRDGGGRIILIEHRSGATEGLFADGPGIEIRPAIRDAAGADAPVVTKSVPDSFQETDLATHLSDGEPLLICGMMTQNCVTYTALTAKAQGREVTVLGDLCTAPSEIVHKIALRGLGSKISVKDAADVLG